MSADDRSGITDMNRRDFFRLGALASGAIAITTKVAPAASADVLPEGIPLLPSQCTPEELAARAAALADARRNYVWSTTVENVEGVPMVETLPLIEEPSVEWILEYVGQLLDLVQNFLVTGIHAVLPEAVPALRPLEDKLTDLKNQALDITWQYEQVAAKYSDATTKTVVEVADKIVIKFIADTAMQISSGIQFLRKSLFDLAETTVRDQHLWVDDPESRDELAMYDHMWATTPIPPVAQRLHDDAFFGYSRLAGPNPMAVRRAEALPDALRLDAQKADAAAGESLAAALAAGRVFVCDYAMLGPMAKEDATYKLITGPGYNTAPIAVFVRAADSSDLMPVAIQVGQKPGESPVFYAQRGDTSAPGYWGWEMAKSVVQAADFNHHEMFSHLGSTHLVSEAFCIATHRTLPPGHPLRCLLEPHFEGDLWINQIAASVIMGKGTFADLILAPEITIQQQCAGQARLDWDLMSMIPEVEIRERGLDDPALDFPYRDDAITIWEDIRTWIDEYVRVYYTDDAAVAGDTDLKAWLTEASTEGKVRGIPDVKDRETLITVLTQVIFTASAQHAAVNYLQKDQMAYAPFMPGMLSDVPREADRTYTAQDWFRMFPGFIASFAQLYFLNVLGTVHYRRLGDYRTNVFPHPECIVDDRARQALDRFRARLTETEKTITARNAGRQM